MVSDACKFTQEHSVAHIRSRLSRARVPACHRRSSITFGVSCHIGDGRQVQADHAGTPPIDFYIVLLMVFGAVVLLTAWLPMVLRELPLSLPIACIALGVGLSWSVLSPLVAANPLADIEITRRLT